MEIFKIICAEKIITDSENDEVSIINIYDNIKSQSYPILLNRISIYISAYKSIEEEDKEMTFQISLNDKILFEDNKFVIKFNNREYIRSVIKFNGFPLETNGKLFIRFFSSENLLSEEIIYLSTVPSKIVSQ